MAHYECSSKVISRHTSCLLEIFETLREKYTELFGDATNLDPK